MLPTYFISHGGGPWPWLDGPFRRQFDGLEQSLKDLVAEIGSAPTAVLMVSGHWEEAQFTVQSAAQPGMVYDYGGFPPHTYQIRYAAPGSPALAARVHTLLTAAGIPAGLDPSRGYDHGTFSPLQAMYPNADVPVVQLSLKHGYDPAAHLAAGRALAPLRSEGVLLVGSGLSFHNLRMFGPAGAAASEAFDGWLAEAMAAGSAERSARLIRWEDAPAARTAHPQEDHLLPLMVAVGAAEQEPAFRVYYERFMGGVAVSSYRFGRV